jgi:hypothetical protein
MRSTKTVLSLAFEISVPLRTTWRVIIPVSSRQRSNSHNLQHIIIQVTDEPFSVPRQFRVHPAHLAPGIKLNPAGPVHTADWPMTLRHSRSV